MATYTLGPGGNYTDLQTAINALSYGDTLIVDHTRSYSGTTGNSIYLPVPHGNVANGYVTIQTDALSSLPATDPAKPWLGRVSPGHASFMPKFGVSSSWYFSGNAILYALPRANYWRLIGIEFVLSD